MIGRRASGVAVDDALDVVAGYVVANDVSGRDLQFADGQWVRGKSLDTFCPIGELVPASAVPDPQALPIRAILNGEVMQDSSTSNMVFGVAEIVAFVSQAITLEPGDLIITGTPAGVGAFRDPPVWLTARRRDHDRDRRRRLDLEPGHREALATVKRAPLLVALFLAALSLRPQLVGIGPLLPLIQQNLDITHAVAGLLGTIPVLCMGLFAPPAPFVSGRIGPRRAVALALALIGVFGVVRAVAPGAVGVILLTFPIGVGMGIAGAILPVTVKERFADRPGFATGVYTTGITIGSAVAAATAVPLAHLAGSWRAPLLVFGVVSTGLAVLWLWLTRSRAGSPPCRRSAPEAAAPSAFSPGGSSPRSSSCRRCSTA